jgi:hypothetical protein
MQPTALVDRSQRICAGYAFLSHERQRCCGHSTLSGGQDATNGSELSHDEFDVQSRRETAGELENATGGRIAVAKAYSSSRRCRVSKPTLQPVGGIEIRTPEGTAAPPQALLPQFSTKSQSRSAGCARGHIKRFFNTFFLIKECFNMEGDH